MDLQIPGLHKPARHDFNTDPESVRQWVADLPLVNTDRTIELLQGALTAMNTLQVPAYVRFDNLEHLADPVRCVTDALKKQYLGRRFPLSEKSLARATLHTALCMKMATGYKIVAAELDKNRKGGTQLEQAIHKAILYLGETLIGYYSIYAPYPAGLWQDLHSLYDLAVRHELADGTSNGQLSPVHGMQSIANAYKQNLLLSLASPYRMRQKDIRSVYALLADWAGLCRLYNAHDTAGGGTFTCHLDSDAPPRYLQDNQREALDSRWLVIETRQLEEPVRETIIRRQESTARLSTLPDEAVLQRLMLSWGMMPKRQFPRHDSEPRSHVRLVVGLAAIHQSIDTLTAAQPEETDAAAEIFDDGEFLRDPTFERITTIDTTPVDSHRTDNPFRGSYAPGSGKADKPVRIETWKMHDTSAGGYCLLWDSDETSNAHVGEVVAISEVERDTDWHLGVIRWMRFTPREGLALGVQMLSPGARPVLVSICKDQAGMEDPMHGVLLPGIPAIDQPATLLLPPLPFHTGCLSTLDEAGSRKTVRLSGQIEDTGSFAQFRFTEENPG